MSVLDDRRVAVVELGEAGYGYDEPSLQAVSGAVDRLGELLGWSAGDGGAFRRVSVEGAAVLVKPNWVAHANQGPWGLDPLITHGSIIQSVVRNALASAAARVMVGDAPLQLCDFERLLRDSGVGGWAAALATVDRRFVGVHDFRRTTYEIEDGRRVVREDLIPVDRFVLFDLRSDSLLEPITDGGGSFRVTQYNPTHMVRTHGPGRHQYLVARAAIDADVVINLPKLKTHKKAGVTCALKNLIGINGNKEYLPHHRLGGSQAGGDCYPGRSRLKRTLEYAFDRLNLADSEASRRFWQAVTATLEKVSRAAGDRLGVEGSWHGNDTIWRTCLDLNRILLYGRPDGSLADEPQRELIHLVDAVIGGHGDGPLAPRPLPLRLLLAGRNAAAVDWVAARLLGYDPERIPIAREAFNVSLWPLADFPPAAIRLLGDLGEGDASDVLSSYRPPDGITYPLGWEAAVAARSERD